MSQHESDETCPYLIPAWHHTVTAVLAQPADLTASHTYILPHLRKPLTGQRPFFFQRYSTRDGLRSLQTASSTVPDLGVNLYISAKPIQQLSTLKDLPLPLNSLVGPLSCPCCYLSDTIHWIACLPSQFNPLTNIKLLPLFSFA